MEYAFWATPGLPLFVVQRGHALMEEGVASVSVFYSVTVLTLFGHIPFAMLLGLYLTWLEIRSAEDSIAIASIDAAAITASTIAAIVAAATIVLGGGAFKSALVWHCTSRPRRI